MARKKTTGKTPQKAPMSSNSARAKQISRGEIKDYFNPKEYRTKSSLDAMKLDAEAYNGGKVWGRGIKPSDYTKGAALVDAGALACYYSQQLVMLRKIYGDRVDDWDGDKIHNTYKHLIGREYAAMLTEREKAKAKKAEEKAKKKEQAARQRSRRR